MTALQKSDISGMKSAEGKVVTARQFLRRGETVTTTATCRDVVKMFRVDPQLNCLAVLDDESHVIGVLRSLDILRRGTEGFFDELLGRRSCTEIMDHRPLVFDASSSLRNMSKAVINLNDRQLVDGFFVTESDRYIGSGRMTDLIKAVAEQRITTAQYANPLTLLPGNVPIDEKIQADLESDVRFVVAYFDLDNFKAFNDVYGYRAGDAVIQLTANIISQAIDHVHDFLGHVGGDDFVVVFKSIDWESRVQQALDNFDEAVRTHFSEAHRIAGGVVTKNRQGLDVFHPLVSLSAGLVKVEAGEFGSHAEISQRLVDGKKLAKQTAGSSYFVDRRQGANTPT